MRNKENRQRPRKYGAFYRVLGSKHERWIRAYGILSGSKAQMVRRFGDWLMDDGDNIERAIRPIPTQRSI